MITMHISQNQIIRFLFVSIILVLILTSWVLVFNPSLKNNHSTFEGLREYAGYDSYVEEIGETLPDPVISTDFLNYNIVNEENGILEINSHYSTIGLLTSEKLYENISTYYVDSKTRKHMDNEEWYFIFPYDVKKQDYLLFDPNMEVPATFVFEGTKYIDNLELFEFSCQSIGDNFSSAWEEFAPEIVYADQTCKTSIEPVTGKTVDFSITWDMYVIRDGEHISIELGGSETTDFTEMILLESAKNNKQIFYIYDNIIPLSIILIFIGIFFASFFSQRSKEKDEIIINQYKELDTSNKVKIELLEKQKKDERLVAIGELSTRLAHDLRNPMTVIQGAVMMIERMLPENKQMQSYTNKVNTAITRMNHQIANVLDYVKNKSLKIEKCSIMAILDSVLEDSSIPDNISIEKQIQDFEIECDSKMLQVVFINLIMNAIQSIGNENGTIVTRISEKDPDNISIQIEDSGPGIPSDVLPQIFEPLFTTKHEGTGLGLTSCMIIIKQHGGTIRVNNNPTTFTITMPKKFETIK